MSNSPLASAHLNNSFERVLASLDRCREPHPVQESPDVSEGCAREPCSRTAWRQLLNKKWHLTSALQ